VAPVPEVLKTGLPETWAYEGCYADAIGNRDTGTDGVEIDSSTGMTAEYCLEQCYALGFDAGGTEYSIQCCELFLFPFLPSLFHSFLIMERYDWEGIKMMLISCLTVCGTSADFTTADAALLGDSACNMVCSGNSTQLCGGAGAISFYTLQ
jgi:hypothetical protein